MKKDNADVKVGDWILCRSIMTLLRFSRPMKVISLRGKTMLNCEMHRRWSGGLDVEPKLVNMSSVMASFPDEESANRVFESSHAAWEETTRKIRVMEKGHDASTLNLIGPGGGKLFK